MNTKENIIDILKGNAGLYDDGDGSVLAVREGHWPRVADEIIELQSDRIEQLEKVVRELVELKDEAGSVEWLVQDIDVILDNADFNNKWKVEEIKRALIKWYEQNKIHALVWEAARKLVKSVKSGEKRVVDADNGKVLEWFSVSETEAMVKHYRSLATWKDVSVDHAGDIILWANEQPKSNGQPKK